MLQQLWLHLKRPFRILKTLGSFSNSPQDGKAFSEEHRSSLLAELDWVIPNKLAVGHLPDRDTDLQHLQHQGIRVILSLCNEEEGSLPSAAESQFHCLRFSLPDSHHPADLDPRDLAQVVDLLVSHLETSGPAYVHCLAGMERSPTVCIAYLCRYYNLELWEALNWLKQIHPRTAPTSAQLQAIQAYLQESLPKG